MRRSLAAATLVASSIVLASCAMPADDPNFGAPQSLGNEVTEEVLAETAEDAAVLSSLFEQPTSIGVDTPLAAAPEAGATIVSFSYGTEYDAVFSSALDEAAAALGWTVETVVVDPADPFAVAEAFDSAVAAAPSGIHIPGTLTEALAESLPAAQTAGVPIICTGCGAEEAVLVTDISIDGPEQNSEYARALATHVQANQYENEDASVQIYALPGVGMFDFNQEFLLTLTDQCHNCGATETFVDPGYLNVTDPAEVSAFVAEDMSLALGEWGLYDSGALSAGVPDALDAIADELLATPIMIGRGATAADIELLTTAGAPPVNAADVLADDGSADVAVEVDELGYGSRTSDVARSLQAWVAIPQPVMAWRVVDQFARILGGEELANGPLPSQFLTGANASEAVVDESGNFIGIADYQDQFLALWGVS